MYSEIIKGNDTMLYKLVAMRTIFIINKTKELIAFFGNSQFFKNVEDFCTSRKNDCFYIFAVDKALLCFLI